MKIAEAIRKADAARANSIPETVKLGWLSKLDGQIDREYLQTHGIETGFAGYGEDTNAEETSLLILAPYDEIYVWFLRMRIDLDLGDMSLYNADGEMYGQALQQWAAQLNRNIRHVMRVDGLRF